MVSFVGAKGWPTISCPTAMSSKRAISLRPYRLAAARADHLAALVEEDIVVDREEPALADELVEAAGLQRDRVARPRRDVVAPALTGVDRAGAAHPVVRRRAGEHQEDVDGR